MTAKTYFTGRPCKAGHIAKRYISTGTCVACAALQCAKWQKENRRRYLDAQNESRRVRLFGLDRPAYESLLSKQRGGCAICGDKNPTRALAIDHNHSCCPGERTCGKCVRGLLCDSCNLGLGSFRDSPDLLARAIEYLSKWA